MRHPLNVRTATSRRCRKVRVMSNDAGPPLKFAAIWGLFAVTMLCAHTLMASHDGQIAMGPLFEEAEQPIMMARLD